MKLANLVCGLAAIVSIGLALGCSKPSEGETASGTCKKDLDCKGGQVCKAGACVAAAGAAPTAAKAAAPAQRNTATFACGATRCKTGQTCCPGAKQPCVASDGCDFEANPGSETNVGYFCDPKTSDGCPANQKCVWGKVGASPMTATANCQ